MGVRCTWRSRLRVLVATFGYCFLLYKHWEVREWNFGGLFMCFILFGFLNFTIKFTLFVIQFDKCIEAC